MKPKTKIQKQASELSKPLRPLPKYIIDRFCQSANDCGRKHYYAVLEQVKDFSVVRFFTFIKHKRKQNECFEYMQVWTNVKGNVVIAKKRVPFGAYFDSFIKDSQMEIRQNKINGYYNRLTDISYSKLFVRSKKAQRAICNYKDNQYCLIGEHNVWLTDDMRVDSFPFLETVIKQKPRIAELLLLNHFRYKQDVVKLAWKHGYLTEKLDYNLWSDTVSMAGRLNLDLHNPVIVCPKDLQATHDLYARRINRQAEREQRQRAVMKAMKDKEGREYFEKFIQKFLNLSFSDGTITIQPLKSIKDFEAEGELMHHCVFAMGYYKKPDTLILSAQVNGEHTETIEIDLKTYSIAQSRGKFNQPSKYHDKIQKLVNKNMNKIKSLTRKAA